MQLLTQFANRPMDEEYKNAVKNLFDIFKQSRELPLLGNAELVILQKAFENLPTSILLETNFPAAKDYVSRQDLKEKVTRWLDELPDEPVLVKV